MERSTLAFILLACLFAFARASRVHPIMKENFDSAFGITPPEGWMNVDLLKSFYYVADEDDQWHFDNPGDQEMVYPIQYPAAVFDSDTISSSNNLPENAALVSAAFDTRHIDWRSTAVVLDWDQHFVEGYDAKIYVEAWDGHKWVEVYSEYQTTPNPDRQAHDISEPVAGPYGEGLKEARVRFRWTGDASWFWVVDNVRVSLVDLRFTTNGCPNHLPHKCPHDGACVRDENECLLDNHCPHHKPRRCLDGECVVDAAKCNDLIDCPYDRPVRCADGSCASHEYECHTAGNCPVLSPVRCYDGSCAATVEECPVYITCPDHLVAFPCIGGTCAPSPEMCPSISPESLVCPHGQVTCLDLTCVDDESQCSCPADYPYLCAETRECVEDAYECKSSPQLRVTHALEQFGGHGAYRLRNVESCPIDQFRCFDGTCVRSLAECPHVLCSHVENEDGVPLPYKCPNGACAQSREYCEPIPACPNRDWKRCSDGTCVLHYEECAPVHACTYGRERCPDGRCYEECPPFNGCPIDHPVECPNGQCVEREVQCYQDCEPGWHTCYDGDACQIFDWDCPAPPKSHKAVPFVGNLRGIARQQTSVYHDIIYIADKNYDDLFATITVPAGVFDMQTHEASVFVADVPDSEVVPLPLHPETISPVLAVHLPDTVFQNGDFIRVSIVTELPQARTFQDYCLAALIHVEEGPYDGQYHWKCQDFDLQQDGTHMSGLVNHTDGLFAIVRKPDVCHKYRGFDDHLLEFIMLGRVLPTTINKLQTTYNKLLFVRDRLPDIKHSDMELTNIAQSIFEFSDQCISTSFQREISTFPPQLGYHPELDYRYYPDPEPCCPCPDGKACCSCHRGYGF